MFAFQADNAEIVRQFHAAGLLAGGQNEGAPGTRPAYGPDFYVAYLRDPDGNKLACVCQHYSPATDKFVKPENRRFAYSILRFCAFTAPDVKWGVPATAGAVGYRPGTNIYLVWADSHRWVNVE